MARTQICLTACLFVLSLFLSFQPVSAYERFQPTTAADRTEAQAFQASQRQLQPGVKLGLALGGGGARGAAHAGVLKILDQEGIKFDYVVGTSIGSVVGGFYCLGVKPEEMEEHFLSGEVMKHFMAVPLTLRLAAAPILYLPRLMGVKPYDGLFGGNKFRHYLMGGMSTKDQAIEDLPIQFAAVTFDLIACKPYLLRKGNLAEAMSASCAVPSLRKPLEVDGKLLSDGGVICNLPVKQCREIGADFVIAVNIDQPLKELPLEHFRHPGSVAQRMLTWGLHDIDEPQQLLADVVIHPDTDGISLISTKRSDARKAILAGEKAARDALPLIREKLGKLKTAGAGN